MLLGCLATILLAYLLTAIKVSHEDVVTSDGEIVRCIDKMKQPAFDNPLLRNHTFQEYPSQIPKMVEPNRKNSWNSQEVSLSTAKCPEGTIPIQKGEIPKIHRTPPETNNNTDGDPVHEYAEISASDPHMPLHGTKAKINVWAPYVENRETEASISQIWIISGDYAKSDLNTVEVGWEVCPGLYGDNKPRLFVYWTSDAYKTTGGYNLRKPGFVQTHRQIVIGGTITPTSTFGGTQYEISILVWKDKRSGNWWLGLGPNNTLVGYWPSEIFTNLGYNARTIVWGGEIVNSNRSGQHTKTQMGSGHFPEEEGSGKSSYFRNIYVVDGNNNFQQIRDPVIQAEGTHYDLKKLHTGESGTQFYYGGPDISHTHPTPIPLVLLCIFFVVLIMFLFSFHYQLVNFSCYCFVGVRFM